MRDYITNLPVTIGAARIADLVRDHEGIENNPHGVLDDTFQEDRSRLRTGHAARHRATLRRIALNFLTILQHYFRLKLSIRRFARRWPATPTNWKPIMAL